MVEREPGMGLCQLGVHSRVVWMVIVFGLADKLLYVLQESSPNSPRKNLSFLPGVSRLLEKGKWMCQAWRKYCNGCRMFSKRKGGAGSNQEGRGEAGARSCRMWGRIYRHGNRSIYETPSSKQCGCWVWCMGWWGQGLWGWKKVLEAEGVGLRWDDGLERHLGSWLYAC